MHSAPLLYLHLLYCGGRGIVDMEVVVVVGFVIYIKTLDFHIRLSLGRETIPF